MAEANQVSPNGLPELIIKDAPPEITVPGLKLTRPQLYYGEVVQDPVFVRTAQPEFDYPAGRAQRRDALRRQGRLSDFLAAAAHRGRRLGERLEHLAHRLPHAGEPHDDPP